MMRAAVLSLGSVNADFQVRVPGPIEGVTSPGCQFLRTGGGKAANVAYLARRFGVDARLIGRVGDDDLAEQALRPLRVASVDLNGVFRAPGQPTGVAMIAVAPQGTKSIVVAANANDSWTPQDGRDVAAVIAAAPRGSVLVVDYEIPAFIVRVAVEAASRMGFPVIVDPSFPERVERGLLSAATVITPDATETRALTGIDPDGAAAAIRAAQRIAAWGVRMVCIKLADGSCLIAQDGCHTLVPSLGFERVDSTGAGDAFAGALAVGLLDDRPAVEAVCLACAAAHASVTRYGSQASYPTRDEVRELSTVLLERACTQEERGAGRQSH